MKFKDMLKGLHVKVCLNYVPRLSYLLTNPASCPVCFPFLESVIIFTFSVPAHVRNLCLLLALSFAWPLP